MNKHDNESEFGLRVFIRFADTHTHTHTKTAAEGDGLRKLNGKTGSVHSRTGVSFHSCAISETEIVKIYSFSRVVSTSCF
jgi:hypothetical protein